MRERKVMGLCLISFLALCLRSRQRSKTLQHLGISVVIFCSFCFVWFVFSPLLFLLWQSWFYTSSPAPLPHQHLLMERVKSRVNNVCRACMVAPVWPLPGDSPVPVRMGVLMAQVMAKASPEVILSLPLMSSEFAWVAASKQWVRWCSLFIFLGWRGVSTLFALTSWCLSVLFLFLF